MYGWIFFLLFIIVFVASIQNSNYSDDINNNYNSNDNTNYSGNSNNRNNSNTNRNNYNNRDGNVNQKWLLTLLSLFFILAKNDFFNLHL